MEYVASLEKKINDTEDKNQYLDRRISYLEELMHNHSLPMFLSHNFNSVQDNSMDFPIGLNFFPSSSQASSNNPPPTNRTARTHQDMLARCDANDCNDSPHAGLVNTGVICYANAIFQALASLRHLTILFNVPPSYNSGTFPLNHTFCTVLHSMVNQDSVADASTFVDHFFDRHKHFQHEERKFIYDIVFPNPFHT